MKKLTDFISKNTFFLIILIASLLILFINFDENYNYHITYPNPGSTVPGAPWENTFLISGEVLKVNSQGFELGMDNDININVISAEKVNKGDFVQILGFIQSPNTFKEIRIIKTDRWGDEFLFIRSFMGLMLFLFIFLKYWKFNLKTFSFRRK